MGITVDGIFISCEMDSELQFDKDLIPASSVSSGKHTEYVPGKRNWSMSVNMTLLKRKVGADFKTLFQAYYEDKKVRVQFRTRPVVDQFLIFEGDAWVKSGGASAPRKGYSTGNMVLIGNGILNMNWEEFWLIINAMPADAEKPYTVDTRNWGE